MRIFSPCQNWRFAYPYFHKSPSRSPSKSNFPLSGDGCPLLLASWPICLQTKVCGTLLRPGRLIDLRYDYKYQGWLKQGKMPLGMWENPASPKPTNQFHKNGWRVRRRICKRKYWIRPGHPRNPKNPWCSSRLEPGFQPGDGFVAIVGWFGDGEVYMRHD